MVNRLRQYTGSPEISSQVIQSLEQDGYLDEEKTLKILVEYFKNSSKSRSLGSFKQALLRKGFEKEPVENALSLLTGVSEEGKVLHEAVKKLKTLSREPHLKKKIKLQTFLYRKGYPSEVIRAVVDSLL